jgi:3-hydroxybutyryl-CoA dehydratase
MMEKGKTCDELEVGMVACLSRTVTEADVVMFGGVTGDLNPAHLDEVYAAASPFKGRIAHGMLGAGYISAVLGMRLPGPGTIYLEQTLGFKAPVRPGDTITATVELVEKMPGGRCRFTTTCTNQDDTVVITGEAIVLPPG